MNVFTVKSLSFSFELGSMIPPTEIDKDLEVKPGSVTRIEF